MKSKTAKNGVFGMIATTGLYLCGCDTQTPTQLFFIALVGIALMLVGGRGLIINNRG